jgi:hypothetical protein
MNEGLARYIERRILEDVYGPEYARMDAVVGLDILEQSLRLYSDRPALSALVQDLRETDPDEAFSMLSYEKGYALLVHLEARCSRPRFEAWLRAFVAEYAFRAVCADTFVAHITAFFANERVLDTVDWAAWLHSPGYPLVPVSVTSAQAADVQAAVADRALIPSLFRTFNTMQRVLLLESLAGNVTSGDVDRLYVACGIDRVRNADVLLAWHLMALSTKPAMEHAERAAAFAAEWGRTKYCFLTYRALVKAGMPYALLAEDTFNARRAFYHPSVVARVSRLFQAGV